MYRGMKTSALRKRTPDQWHSLILKSTRNNHLRLHLHSVVWWDFGASPYKHDPEEWQEFKTKYVRRYFQGGIHPYSNEEKIVAALKRLNYKDAEKRIYRETYKKNYKQPPAHLGAYK